MKTIEVIYNDMDKQRLINKLSKLSITKPIRVEFSFFKSNRSAAQGRLYWMWVQEIIDHFIETMGEYKTKREIDAWLLDMFAPMEIYEVKGRAFGKVKSTSSMTTKEMSEYHNKIDTYCVTTLELFLTKPPDAYAEAMGFKKNTRDDRECRG